MRHVQFSCLCPLICFLTNVTLTAKSTMLSEKAGKQKKKISALTPLLIEKNWIPSVLLNVWLQLVWEYLFNKQC